MKTKHDVDIHRHRVRSNCSARIQVRFLSLRDRCPGSPFNIAVRRSIYGFESYAVNSRTARRKIVFVTVEFCHKKIETEERRYTHLGSHEFVEFFQCCERAAHEIGHDAHLSSNLRCVSVRHGIGNRRKTSCSVLVRLRRCIDHMPESSRERQVVKNEQGAARLYFMSAKSPPWPSGLRKDRSSCSS